VVLTRGGDLAWLASTYDRAGEVALARPGRAPRVLDRYASADLGLEDGRTLRWRDPAGYHRFFDLRHVPCPSRSRFAPELQTDRVSSPGAATPARSCSAAATWRRSATP
jgi:hypothetical protein